MVSSETLTWVTYLYVSIICCLGWVASSVLQYHSFCPLQLPFCFLPLKTVPFFYKDMKTVFVYQWCKISSTYLASNIHIHSLAFSSFWRANISSNLLYVILFYFFFIGGVLKFFEYPIFYSFFEGPLQLWFLQRYDKLFSDRITHIVMWITMWSTKLWITTAGSCPSFLLFPKDMNKVFECQIIFNISGFKYWSFRFY